MRLLFKTISLSSDHAGFNLKENIKKYLIKQKVRVIDLGPFDNKSVDYPDYAKKVSKNVILKKSNVGILVCGSGTGMAISANKFKKMRACLYNIIYRLSGCIIMLISYIRIRFKKKIIKC